MIGNLATNFPFKTLGGIMPHQTNEGTGIRTLESTKLTDLESVPFGHSGIPSTIAKN